MRRFIIVEANGEVHLSTPMSNPPNMRRGEVVAEFGPGEWDALDAMLRKKNGRATLTNLVTQLRTGYKSKEIKRDPDQDDLFEGTLMPGPTD